MAGDRVAAAQDAHVALCRDAGADRCRLIAMERSDSGDRYPVASLKLRVATALAPAFEAGLGKAVRGLDGRATDTNVAADDVSKDLVDTAARIRQRELLVACLTEILRNRQGKLAELVETERSVAQAQEELDQAKGWLAELRRRVAYSDFDIRYAAATPTGRAERIADTLGESAAGIAGRVRRRTARAAHAAGVRRTLGGAVPRRLVDRADRAAALDAAGGLTALQTSIARSCPFGYS